MNESHNQRGDVPELSAEEIQARVLHRDGLMLVIDKPAGLPVHRGPKGGANLETSFDALRFGLPRPPVLAHRLDRDTSGCLVLGRHRKATASLGLLFKHGRVSKTYWAVVEGGPAEDEGTIDMPLGRLNAERGWWQKPDPNGQPAVTRWKVLGRGFFSPPPCGVRGEHSSLSGVGVSNIGAIRVDPPPRPSPARDEGEARPLTWLAMEPVTGRTHQLRVHARALGWPIVGDNIYGNGPRSGEPRLHLHARSIVVPISRNKDPVSVTAPAPAHLHERLRACGWNGE
ncbi:MAG: RNA pseudouridine synthase [Bradyrhizobium sp.]|nr:RNA pseudouridine synthase [Bradyrhizobium sp.]